jgi:hypothetical protein
MGKKKDIQVEVVFTEGWQERFTKAAYELYQEIEEEKQIKEDNNNNSKE